MEFIIVHIPRYFLFKLILFEYIYLYGLTFKHLHERFSSIIIYGSDKAIIKLIDIINNYNKYNVYPIINNKCKKNNYSIMSDCIGINENESTSYFNVKEIINIYNIYNNIPNRVNIAIISLGGGFSINDLNNYWKYLKLDTVPNIYSISVNNYINNPSFDVNADREITLNIEIVGGICPNSNMYVYFTENSDCGLYNALHEAIYNITYPVNIILLTWGAPENNYENKNLLGINDLLAQAAQRNITVCCPVGDSQVNFPASSPWVLACGGSKLICPTKTYSHPSTCETIINMGEGYSSIFKAPQYQSKNLPNNSMRWIPDVYGNANGWILYFNNNYCVMGGTSAAASMWAGYLASLNYSRFFNAFLYNIYNKSKNIVYNINKNNNISGLGSPNGNIITPLIKSDNFYTPTNTTYNPTNWCGF